MNSQTLMWFANEASCTTEDRKLRLLSLVDRFDIINSLPSQGCITSGLDVEAQN